MRCMGDAKHCQTFRLRWRSGRQRALAILSPGASMTEHLDVAAAVGIAFGITLPLWDWLLAIWDWLLNLS